MKAGYTRLVACISLLVCVAGAQAAAGPLAFDVASVKRAADGSSPGDIPRNMDASPGHFAMRNVPLRFAIEWAYDLKDYEVAGPDWIKNEERYDIIASAGHPATDDEMRQMLQTLLTQRFQMKLHRESRELPVYVLSPGKGAAKVKIAAATEATVSSGPSGTNFIHQPIGRFTFLLTRRMDRPVLDQTGLPGVYDFSIDLSGLGFNGNPPAVDTDGPSIFTAVQNDLGLKLEARKQAIPMLIVDFANKSPIEN